MYPTHESSNGKSKDSCAADLEIHEQRIRPQNGKSEDFVGKQNQRIPDMMETLGLGRWRRGLRL